MKKMKSILVLLFTALTLFSCNKDDETTEPVQGSQGNLKVTQNVLNKVKSLSLTNSDVQVFKNTKLDGTTEDAFLIDGDIVMTEDQLNKMDLEGDVITEQWRVLNSVSAANKTIQIVGLSGSGAGASALTANMRAGLEAAVKRYNDLRLSIKFLLSFSSNTSNANIIVRRQVNAISAGLSGTPYGGKPYSFITLSSELDNYSVGASAQVAAHELGHCIGLRHTDWYSRQSCGEMKQEETSAGAVQIPGTPYYAFDATSYMNACADLTKATGVFNANDVRALNALY